MADQLERGEARVRIGSWDGGSEGQLGEQRDAREQVAEPPDSKRAPDVTNATSSGPSLTLPPDAGKRRYNSGHALDPTVVAGRASGLAGLAEVAAA